MHLPLPQVVDEEATAKKKEADAKKAEEEGREAGEVEPVMKTTYEDMWDWRVENENKPIWTRSPKEVRAPPPPLMPCPARVLVNTCNALLLPSPPPPPTTTSLTTTLSPPAPARYRGAVQRVL